VAFRTYRTVFSRDNLQWRTGQRVRSFEVQPLGQSFGRIQLRCDHPRSRPFRYKYYMYCCPLRLVVHPLNYVLLYRCTHHSTLSTPKRSEHQSYALLIKRTNDGDISVHISESRLSEATLSDGTVTVKSGRWRMACRTTISTLLIQYVQVLLKKSTVQYSTSTSASTGVADSCEPMRLHTV
jgi:hypothetical protein